MGYSGPGYICTTQLHKLTCSCAFVSYTHLATTRQVQIRVCSAQGLWRFQHVLLEHTSRLDIRTVIYALARRCRLHSHLLFPALALQYCTSAPTPPFPTTNCASSGVCLTTSRTCSVQVQHKSFSALQQDKPWWRVHPLNMHIHSIASTPHCCMLALLALALLTPLCMSAPA